MTPGISTTDACTQTGITYRTLDYWARNGAVTPSIAEAEGQGTRRLWNRRDIRILTAIGKVTADLQALGADMPVDLVDRLWRELNQRADVVIHQGSVSISISVIDAAPAHLGSEVR